jgi:phage terminase small subunit
MPRQSVEARAAEFWRKGRTLPDAPEYLSDKAKSLWKVIVSCKPPGWFDEGNYPLLAMYCDLVAEAEELSAQRNSLPVMHREAARLRRAHLATVGVMTMLAVKLRLTPQQSIHRRAGMLNERGSPRHPLLGGKDH